MEMEKCEKYLLLNFPQLILYKTYCGENTITFFESEITQGTAL